MLTTDHIDRLDPCEPGCEDDGPCEMKDALRWLVGRSVAYKASGQVPPLEPAKREYKARRFATMTARLARKSRSGSGLRIWSFDFTADGQQSRQCRGAVGDLLSFLSAYVLSPSRNENTPSLIVTCGLDRTILDVFMQQFGPGLCSLGYTIKPALGSSGVIFLTISKGRKQWQLVYVETITGASLSTLHSFAKDVGRLGGKRFANLAASELYSVTAVYQAFLSRKFGAAINLTAGMTAASIVRQLLPVGFKKWKPTPLMIAMERDGKGYRGGMNYAERFRGQAWRVDVNRQYTHALGFDLPYRSAFGRYVSEKETPHGVFLCRVLPGRIVSYPMGRWNGDGFDLETMHGQSLVSVLHSSEFAGLRRLGCDIVPYYGYIYTHCFTLAHYRQLLQDCLDSEGRDSPASRIVKPLGNYVYGKFGQNPVRDELLYSVEPPDYTWFPYHDSTGKDWPGVWQRKRKKDTSLHHVDIAATITGYARSQTASMWASVLASGARVVRCHTDSLTVTADPAGIMSLSDTEIGGWRLENEYQDTVIVGANAFIDQDGAHIAGVSHPTQEMIERIYDGQVVYVVQDQKVPLQGFRRGTRSVTRRYG